MGYAEDISAYSIDFPQDIRNEKTKILIERVNSFAEMLKNDDYSALESLWFNKRENITFDGNFNIAVTIRNYIHLPQIDITEDIKNKQSKIKEIGVLITHWAGGHPSAENVNDMGPNFHQNVVLLGFFDGTKICCYDEFGTVINETVGLRLCIETGLPECFQISLRLSEEKSCEHTDWTASKYGDKIGAKDIILLSKMNDLPRFAASKNSKRSQWGVSPKLPVTNDKELKEFFDSMLLVMKAKKRDDMVVLLEQPLIKSLEHKFGQISFLNWKCQWGYFIGETNADSKEVLQGYAYAHNSDGFPTFYVTGNIKRPEQFQGIPSLNGTGIEVKFHPTGYPASYKTIVRNRLFGRQIEWNDKGEVISDVDLDIPKPWADAPKKATAPVAMRTWTSSGGKYHIRAEYVSADENQVILKNEDGKIFPVALSKLSKDDRNYVKEQLKAKPELPKRGKE
ncbi:MAG: hypothetical protein LBT24_06760 [Tannerella sp.]|jgi:hypothetical protein|nr:hypothetical protein [Tannerella sp.]